MIDDLNDPVWLTQRAAVEIVRYAVDSVCEKARSLLFRRPAKIDRTYAREAASPAFARALSDKLARLVEVEVEAIRETYALSDLASTLLERKELRLVPTVRLFAAMSLAFDYALRRRLSTRPEWLDPWHEWKYFLPTPTGSRDEDFVLMCAQLSGIPAPELGEEMLEDSPVLVVDTMCRIDSVLREQTGELVEAYNNGGVDGLVRAFDERRGVIDPKPYNANIARAAVVYVVSGECCWGRQFGDA